MVARRSWQAVSAVDVAAKRRRDLAAIHASAAKLGMDTADKEPTSDYRSMLLTVGGAASAADLTTDGRRKVLAHLQKCLGQPASPRRTQVDVMQHLWDELRGQGALLNGEAELQAFVKRMTGVDDARWLSSTQASVVIEALKAWLKRVTPPRAAGGPRRW